LTDARNSHITQPRETHINVKLRKCTAEGMQSDNFWVS